MLTFAEIHYSVFQQFPVSAKRVIGHELNEVQEGRDPSDYRPMSQIGKGVYEIRVRVEEGIFRTMYSGQCI